MDRDRLNAKILPAVQDTVTVIETVAPHPGAGDIDNELTRPGRASALLKYRAQHIRCTLWMSLGWEAKEAPQVQSGQMLGLGTLVG